MPAAARLAASLNEMSSPASDIEAPESLTSEIEDTFASAIASELSAAGLPGADSLSATASPAGVHGDDKTIPPIVEFSNSEQDTQAVPNTAKIETSDTSPRSTGHGAQDDNLLSQDTGEAVSGAFNALTHTILAQNARTLDDLVREMLEPMLKEWLDDNLPSLVERMVRQEIDRVSRGRK
ncbi:MAG: PopZ family protein [Alphaproteobacteria bacterium]